VFIWFAALWAA